MKCRICTNTAAIDCENKSCGICCKQGCFRHSNKISNKISNNKSYNCKNCDDLMFYECAYTLCVNCCKHDDCITHGYKSKYYTYDETDLQKYNVIFLSKLPLEIVNNIFKYLDNRVECCDCGYKYGRNVSGWIICDGCCDYVCENCYICSDKYDYRFGIVYHCSQCNENESSEDEFSEDEFSEDESRGNG